MTPTVSLQSLSDLFQSHLGLAFPPIAVTFAAESGASAAGYEGTAPAGCSFWQIAGQSESPVRTTAADHEMCSIGIYTHNLGPAPARQDPELAAVLGVLGQMEYVRAEDIPGIPRLEQGRSEVTYSRLAQAEAVPDVVLLFANPRQGLVIVEAIQQVDGAPPPALGRPACAVVAQAINSGNGALSFGCCGARAYLDWMTDDVSLWALPGSKLDQYAARIEKLAAANQTLRQFHLVRLEDVKTGSKPTYAESLNHLMSR